VSWGAWCVAARHADRERRGWAPADHRLGWGGRFFYGPNAERKAARDRRRQQRHFNRNWEAANRYPVGHSEAAR
jgi:hypothetical protein